MTALAPTMQSFFTQYLIGQRVLGVTDLEDGRVNDGAAGLGVRKPRPICSGGALVVVLSRWWSG